MESKTKVSLNPTGITNIGDPFILFHQGTYYLYATSFIDGFYVWTSKDLQSWSKPTIAYQKNNGSFGNSDFWAPEVIYHQGRFIMHYSARMAANQSLRIGVAVSDHPLGPFIDVYDQQPMFDLGYAVIDGHVFIDHGVRYFYFSRDCSEYVVEGRHESHLYVATLTEDFTALTSEPKPMLKPEQTWETITGEWRWNEGPFVTKHNDTFYLMYSSGFYASSTYGIGYATSKSPLGPFTKAAENPILKTIPSVISGPGHNCLFLGHDQQLYSAYHVHTYYEQPSHDRQVFIDRVHFHQNKLSIEGPTIRLPKIS
jgi:beta-xylosidase